MEKNGKESYAWYNFGKRQKRDRPMWRRERSASEGN